MMYLLGAGGHAKVILDILMANKTIVNGIYDDNLSKKDLNGIPVIDKIDSFDPSKGKCIVGIGSNEVRYELVKKMGLTEYGRAIHPSSVLSPSCKIGQGSVVMAGAIINPDTIIGNHAIVNTTASIDHDCFIEDYCHLAPNSTLCGGVSVGEGTFIGAGAVLIPNIKVGKWAIVGAGAVVVKNVEDYTVVVGNPARTVKIREVR
ncbi:MAG: acetyltransferase [Bacteroidota bacterium]